MIARLRAWLFPCDHRWENTGASYTDSHGTTIVLRQCKVCHETHIAPV